VTGRPGDHRLERLVHWALGPEVLAAADVPHVVTVVTDTLAAILGAAGEPEVRGFAERAPSIGGSGPCTVLASGATTGAALAAWANGLAAVRLELDEGNQFAANHPAAHVFPAALATAEAVGARVRSCSQPSRPAMRSRCAWPWRSGYATPCTRSGRP